MHQYGEILGNVKPWRKILFTLAIIIFFSLCAQSVVPSQAAGETSESESFTGWKTKNNAKYYYKNGVKVTGWQTIKGSKYHFTSSGKMDTYWKKISGKYYYFGKNGKLSTNKIAGTKKKGRYYVDSKGIRVSDKTVKKAVSFVNSYSKSSQSDKQRLKSCFKKLNTYSYQRIYGDKPSKSTMASYANYMFTNKKGNCYRFATAMAYIGRVLGYDTRVAIGAIDSTNNGSFSAHSWCEVKINGKWKIVDCTFTRSGKGNFFLVDNSYYTGKNMTLRCDKRFKLTVTDGKPAWKKAS